MTTIEHIIADPARHEILKRWLLEALTLDPVDVANDAELLAAVLRARADRLLAEAQR